ncbi:unnamed protein product [Paramecium octaurelia]|uniref:Uncharacterized protein n=1 Tax=Paramecium octaurelia TaxID=43137 RepID=A0A8S1YCS1_PAROT|nr:unnamed protein product [Paramecium octaurelia]
MKSKLRQRKYLAKCLQYIIYQAATFFYIFINKIKQQLIKMGSIFGFHKEVQICTGCREILEPDQFYCRRCKTKGLKFFGFACFLAILIRGSVALQLSDNWIEMLTFLMVTSLICCFCICGSKVTTGKVKGKYIEYEE